MNWMKLSTVTVIGFFVGFTSSTQAESLSDCRPMSVKGKTMSQTASVFSASDNYSQVWNQLKGYKVLLFTGLTGDLLAKMGPKVTGSPYYGSLPEKLNQQNIEFELVNWPGMGGGSVERNAIHVNEIISESTKPVVVVAHSKGGADVIEALTTKTQVFKSKVKGVVLLQSAFRGSPLADKPIATGGSAIFSGIGSMKTSARTKYVEDNLGKVCSALGSLEKEGVSVLNLVTSKPAPYDGLITLYHKTLGAYPTGKGERCGLDDGFVDVSEAMIPCDSVSNQYLSGFDHLNLLFSNETTEKMVANALLKVL